jgi:hypothetical protein
MSIGAVFVTQWFSRWSAVLQRSVAASCSVVWTAV